MKTILVLLFLFPFISFAKPKYGPEVAPKAVPLWQDREYFSTSMGQKSDFWALIGYYVPQYNPYSCSAGALSVVLNGALTLKPKTSDTEVVLQESLVKSIKTEHWADRLSKKGHLPKGKLKPEWGTSLDVFSHIAADAFKNYGFPKVDVKTVHVSGMDMLKTVATDLEANEGNPRNFIVANFNQIAFTDDAEAGHLAAVGAYDAKKKRVLILDPDRQYYEPYWVSLETFVAGMATQDSGASQNRGYVLISVGE